MLTEEAPISEADRAAILATAADYIESWLGGDAERMGRALHPDLRKRAPWTDPSRHPEAAMNEDTWASMVEGTREGEGTKLEPGYQVEILDAYGPIATVALLSSAYMDYLHVARFADGWKIVNVLWRPRPR
ncbi:MAG TPA: nuclear transport factor 2 family protein [Candidatus Limnocylindrales bacterium]